MARQKNSPIATAAVRLGPSHAVRLFGLTATSEHGYGIPTVEISDDIDGLRRMLPETADELADALKQAARAARGEDGPSALDAFLAKRAAS